MLGKLQASVEKEEKKWREKLMSVEDELQKVRHCDDSRNIVSVAMTRIVS